MDVPSPLIYPYPLSFWLTLPQGVLSTSWCCLSRLCVVFLACVHLALFLALFLSPGNSLGSSWYHHRMLASLLWQCLVVPSLLQFCWEPTHLFSLLSTKHAESSSVLSSQRPQDVFLHSSWISSFHSCTWLQATLALSLVWSSLKSVCCDFSLFSAVIPIARIACPLFILVRNSLWAAYFIETSTVFVKYIVFYLSDFTRRKRI